MASRSIENLMWATVGAGLGYLLTRRYLEPEFQKRLDGQIENAEEFYRRKYEKKLKELREKDVAEGKEILEVLRAGVEEVEKVYEEQAESIIAEAGMTSTLTNYQGMFDGENTPSQPKKNLAPEPVVSPSEETETSHPPVIISQEAFMENTSGYTQLSRTYYAGDDILATENNKIVSDGVRQNTLGDEVVEKLKMGLDGDAEVIYVRNKTLSMEYEVFRDPHMYTEAVGPIGSVE